MSGILERFERQAIILGDHTMLNDILELKEREEQGWKPRYARILQAGEPQAAGGMFYQDTRPPFTIADGSAVTLAATAKALWTAAELTPTYKNDWFIGKKMHLRVFGKITTAATPGNLTVSVAYGTADNTGLLASSAALTLIASQTNISWRSEFYIDCRAIGASGSLFATGVFECNPAVIAAGQAIIPASAAVATAADLTATSAINLQFARSGSTAETATVQQIAFAALN